jgi:hypothetical protein
MGNGVNRLAGSSAGFQLREHAADQEVGRVVPVGGRSTGLRNAVRQSRSAIIIMRHATRFRSSAIWAAIALVSLFSMPGAAFAAGKVECNITFSMSGWSAFYKTSTGVGTIKCSNGQSAKVKLDTKGGGPTVGKSTIDNGRGQFSGVSNIDELFGSYISAEAGAGAGKSANANVMTKGEVSLAISGTGHGWELGIAFGRLSITRG